MSYRSMGFRHSVRGERKRASKGWRGNYRDQLRIPKDEPTPVLLMRGEYEDMRADEVKNNGGAPPIKNYYPFVTHPIKFADSGKGSFRELPCSGDQCVPCWSKDGGDKRITTRTKFAMNVLHLAVYAKEQAKKDGKPIFYDKDGDKHRKGDPIMDWVEVKGRQDLKAISENAQALVKEGEVALFRRKYIEVGSNHLDHLMIIDEEAAKRCFCGGRLAPSKYYCAKCDDLLCDIEQTNMTPGEINDYGAQRQRCRSCGTSDFARVVSICDSCEEPTPLSAFDVVAWIRRHGEDTASAIVVTEIVPLTEYVGIDGQGLVKDWNVDAAGVTPVWADHVKDSMVQFDFAQVFAPPDAAYAAQTLKIDNPFKAHQTAAGAQRYVRQYTQANQAAGQNLSQQGQSSPQGAQTPTQQQAPASRFKRG